MTYDHWKTTEPDGGAERPSDECAITKTLCDEVDRLRASHAKLLVAAKAVITKCPVPRGVRRPEFDALEDAIADQDLIDNFPDNTGKKE